MFLLLLMSVDFILWIVRMSASSLQSDVMQMSSKKINVTVILSHSDSGFVPPKPVDKVPIVLQ